MRSLLVAVVLCLGCGGSTAPPDLAPADLGPDFAGEDMAPPAQTYPIDVPMTTELAQGNMRFAVQVQVGAAPPFMALLDTGSAGLRVKPGVLPRDAYDEVLGTTEPIVYGGYLLAEGIAVNAHVSIGGAETGVIPIEVFTKLSCASGQPGCVVSDETVANFSGYDAILGVGVRTLYASPTIGSPIPLMNGEPGYIVRAPSFPGTMGTLRIGPTAEDLASFKMLQLAVGQGEPLTNGLPSYDDLTVPVCVEDSTTSASYCAAGLLDCGAPTTIIGFPNASTDGALPAGDMVHVVVGDPSAPLGTYDFTVGTMPQQGNDLVYLYDATSATVSLGTALFFRYDEFVEQKTGRIGLLAHP